MFSHDIVYRIAAYLKFLGNGFIRDAVSFNALQNAPVPRFADFGVNDVDHFGDVHNNAPSQVTPRAVSAPQ